MTWQVRSATAEDARSITNVHIAAWKAAYRHVFPAEFLNALSVEQRTESWTEILSRIDAESPERWAFVAVEDDDVIGFVSCFPSRDEDGAGIAEVGAIYVDPQRWRRSIGAALMRAAVKDLIAAGYLEATLWVLDANPRARSFYEKEGWSTDGTSKSDTIGGVDITEVRYRRRLA